MKLNQIKTHTESAASAAALDTAIAAFALTIGEAIYVDIRFAVDSAVFSALIIYVN